MLISCPYCAQVNEFWLEDVSMAVAHSMRWCSSCRKELPHVEQYQCPICQTIGKANTCTGCGADMQHFPLRPFGTWPELPPVGRVSQQELEKQLNSAMPPLHVGGRLLAAKKLYPALTQSFNTYLRLLGKWTTKALHGDTLILRKVYEKRMANTGGGIPLRRSILPFLSEPWNLEALRELDGYDFEVVLAVVFLKMGWTVFLTPSRGDQGADLIVTDSRSVRFAVQAKNTQSPVGNAAVQEVLGGMAYYHCGQGIVVATAEFTSAAQQLAVSHRNVELWGPAKLEELWSKYSLQRVD
jgi:hypothetical protein